MRWITLAVLVGGAALAAIPGTASAADNLLDTIKDRGTMRVCNIGYTPWNVINPATNEWEGINPDIAQELANRLEVTLENVDATWVTVVQSIASGKCDFSIATSYVSAKRAEVVTFTDPYAVEGMGVFVPADSPATSIADLDQPDKVITVIAGSAIAPVARETFKNATVRDVVSDKVEAGVLEVAAGRAHAAVGGYSGLVMFLKANSGIQVKPMEGVMLNPSPIAFMVPAKEYFFRDWINAALSELDAKGAKQEIIDKWLRISDR